MVFGGIDWHQLIQAYSVEIDAEQLLVQVFQVEVYNKRTGSNSKFERSNKRVESIQFHAVEKQLLHLGSAGIGVTDRYISLSCFLRQVGPYLLQDKYRYRC